MTTKAKTSPKKRIGCLKVFLLGLIVLLALIIGSIYLLLRPLQTASLSALGAKATGGMLLFHADMYDPRISDLFEVASGGELTLQDGPGRTFATMLRPALVPELVMLMQYEPGGDPLDPLSYFQENEGGALVIQFERFYSIFYKYLRSAASDPAFQGKLDVEDDHVRFELAEELDLDEIFVRPALTRSALVIASGEQTLSDVLAGLPYSGTPEEKHPSARHRELFERCMTFKGQVRGYYVAPTGRIRDFIAASEAAALFSEIEPSSIWDFLLIGEFDEIVEAILIHGELLENDAARMEAILIARDEDSARLVEDAAREVLFPKWREIFGAEFDEPELKRAGNEVTITVEIEELAAAMNIEPPSVDATTP